MYHIWRSWNKILFCNIGMRDFSISLGAMNITHLICKQSSILHCNSVYTNSLTIVLWANHMTSVHIKAIPLIPARFAAGKSITFNIAMNMDASTMISRYAVIGAFQFFMHWPRQIKRKWRKKKRKKKNEWWKERKERNESNVNFAVKYWHISIYSIYPEKLNN